MDPFTLGAPTGRKRRASIFGGTLAPVAPVFGACQTVTSPTPGGATPTPGTPTPTPVAFTPPTDDFRVVAVPPGEPLHIAFWGVLSGGARRAGVPRPAARSTCRVLPRSRIRGLPADGPQRRFPGQGRGRVRHPGAEGNQSGDDPRRQHQRPAAPAGF